MAADKITIKREWFETCTNFGDNEQLSKALYDVVKVFFDDEYKPKLNACGTYLHARVWDEVARASLAADKHREAGKKGGRPKTKNNQMKPNGFETQKSDAQVIECDIVTKNNQMKPNGFSDESSDYIYNNINNILRDNNIKEEKYKKEETKNNQMVLLINGEDISECKGSEDEERWSKYIPQPWHSLLMFWCRHKARIGKRYKCKQPIKARYKELIEFSNNDPTTAAAIIEQSINNGWEGLFKLNQNGDNRKHTIETEREQRGKAHAAMLASLLGEGRSNSEADADNTSGIECF